MVIPFLQNTTFTGNISTENYGTAEQWNSAYTTLQNVSSLWTTSVSTVSGINYIDNLTVLQLISTLNYGTAEQWNNAFTLVTQNSSIWSLALTGLSGDVFLDNLTVNNVISTLNYGTAQQWNDAYTLIAQNSSIWSAALTGLSGDAILDNVSLSNLTVFNTISTLLYGTAEMWYSVFTNVQQNSSVWTSGITGLSGGVTLANINLDVLTVTDYISTQKHGTSQQWYDSYTTVAANSGTWTTSITTISGINIINNLSVITTLSTQNFGTAENWYSVYTHVLEGSGNWLNLDRLKILEDYETDINLDNFDVFLKTVSSSNEFTFTGFTSGKTALIYLSSAEFEPMRHYFPSSTYFAGGANSNTLYTFPDKIVRAYLYNIGDRIVGIANTIDVNVSPVFKPQGDSILLDGTLGFLLQEDNSYILL